MTLQQFSCDKVRERPTPPHPQMWFWHLSMSCAWLVDGWEKHQHATDKSLGFQWIHEYTHTHFLQVIDFLPTLWLNADCSNMTPYQEFIPPPCGCDWNVSHSWANTDCIRSLTPLIDRPGQFISHCDSFLYSLGRQGKRRGMQIKSSRNIVHNTYCVLIAGWTVTSRMFSTYLSVCGLVCYSKCTSGCPVHSPSMLTNHLTSGKLQTFGSKCSKKTRGNSSGSTIKRSEPRTMAWRPWTSAFIRLSLLSSAGTRVRKNIGRRQRKFS